MSEESLDRTVKALEAPAPARCGAVDCRRFEEIRSPRPPTGRQYSWLFIGWICVVAGLLIPPYAFA